MANVYPRPLINSAKFPDFYRWLQSQPEGSTVGDFSRGRPVQIGTPVTNWLNAEFPVARWDCGDLIGWFYFEPVEHPLIFILPKNFAEFQLTCFHLKRPISKEAALEIALGVLEKSFPGEKIHDIECRFNQVARLPGECALTFLPHPPVLKIVGKRKGVGLKIWQRKSELSEIAEQVGVPGGAIEVWQAQEDRIKRIGECRSS